MEVDVEKQVETKEERAQREDVFPFSVESYVVHAVSGRVESPSLREVERLSIVSREIRELAEIVQRTSAIPQVLYTRS